MLEKLKEDLIKELEDFERKGISVNNLSVVDSLARTTKNVCKIMEAGEGGYSERSYRSMSRDGSYDDMSHDGSYGYEYGESYRRGRDSMGRYTSRHGGMKEKLEELMDEAPDEQTRRDLQKIMQKMR